MANETTHNRLDRIENKIDDLADAMISMARAEEKLVAMKEDHDKMYERVNRLSQKLDDIERRVLDNYKTVQVINKLFWVAIVTAAGAIAAHVWM